MSATLIGRTAIAQTPDGRTVRSIAISSPGAVRLRVHFQNFDAGAGEVWVFGPQDEFALAPYTSKGIFGDGEFWSGEVEGDTVVVAYLADPANSSTELPFTIDAISHRWTTLVAGTDRAASCNLDVSCYPAYKNFASAVAVFTFIGDADGGVYDCSGSMINTRSGSFKPYFLTAHHCISSNAEARSMQLAFLYQTSVCGGPPPNPYSLPVVVGGTYLAGGGIPQGDYALVQLTNAPGNVVFLGWNLTLDTGAPAAGIHHPQLSYTRISFGTRGADQDTNVEGEIAPGNLYYKMNWSSGLTEHGSSGSPLVNTSGQIFGTLTGVPFTQSGLTACQIPQSAYYGRFSNAYTAISSYLNDVQPASLAVNPSSLAFQVTNGLASPGSQTVSLSTQSQSALSVIAQTNQPWLHVSGASTVSASAPNTLAVTLDPSLLKTAGRYSGTVTISSASTAPVSVAVSVTLATKPSSVTVTVTPNPVYQQAPDADGYSWFYTVRCTEQAGVDTQLTGFKIGGVDYSSQAGSVFGTTRLNGFGSVVANIRTRNLTVPITQPIEVDGVDPGSNRTWQATTQVQFLSPIAPAPVLSLSRSSLNFSYTLGAANPVPQQVTVLNLGGGTLQWSASSDSSWLTVTPANGTAPSAAIITVNASGLAPGSYAGEVTIGASGIGSSKVSVALTVTGAVTVSGIVEPAAYRADQVCSGCLVTIFGAGFSTAVYRATSLPLSTSLGGVSVTFNGIAAPVLYVSQTQINAQVPNGLEGNSARVVVQTPSGYSAPVQVLVAHSAPGILTLNGSGSGAGVVVNITNHVITSDSPIEPGGYATIYGTGFGPVSPEPSLGAPAAASPLSVTRDDVTVFVGGIKATVLFSGLAPGFVGLYQINIQVPPSVTLGPAVELRASVGGSDSNSVTLAVK